MSTATRIGLTAAVVVVALAAALLLATGARPVASAPSARPHPAFEHRRSPSGGPPFATVPDVLDEPLHTASRTLLRARFQLHAARRVVPGAIPGEVIAMRPAPGSLVPSETTIVLVVARRPRSSLGPP